MRSFKGYDEVKVNNFPERLKLGGHICKVLEAKIEALPDDNLREVLYNKYILGQTLEEISFTLNYSKRHIERLHVKALEKFTL